MKNTKAVASENTTLRSGSNERKVLIVDDIELNRGILAVALGDKYEVIQAADGVQTIDILKSESEGITAMLLDLIMPNVDGYAVLDYMREHGLLDRIPVIVISAESARDVEVKCLEMGLRISSESHLTL